VDRLSVPETLEWVSEAVREGKPRRIAVVNANKLFLMSRNARLKAIVQRSDLIVPEWAVVWGACRLGLPGVCHSGGLLISKALIPFAEETGLRLFFFGGTPEVVAALVHRLTAAHPRLKVAGHHHGYVRDAAGLAKVCRLVSGARPDVLLVAMGSPAQEYWICDHAQPLGVPVSMGVGGTFDVLSDRKKDTPAWARGRGLEWLYRTVQSPRTHAKRYFITNTWFLWQVLKARLIRTH
jgi:N-acetylglucosaminyldiphosphoundecaprenol N-acetyl-beta-D-mannosaminyltransferase